MTFNLDPKELHQFPDHLFRRELQVPANLRELIEDLDAELAARLDFERVQLWKREHVFEDWRHFERDLPFLVPYRSEPDGQLLLCLLLEHQSQADRLMPLRMLVNGSMFWESEWKAWEASTPKGGPLELTPIVPVVFHTGLTRWISNRTLAELVGGPEELRDLAPHWPIRFWDLAEHTAEELLAASGPWLNALAVVRATNEEASRFLSVFAAAVERLAGLVARERMRWRDLMWMLISWALRRRPRQERASLVAVALEYQPDPSSQEEVQSMSTTLGQTLEEWAEQRGIEQGIQRGIEQGIEQGIKRGELAASRRLLCCLLEDRFGPVPDDLRRQIDEIKDLARLERSIRQYPSLRSLDELNF
jgi:predicted transposase YdaD